MKGQRSGHLLEELSSLVPQEGRPEVLTRVVKRLIMCADQVMSTVHKESEEALSDEAAEEVHTEMTMPHEVQGSLLDCPDPGVTLDALCHAKMPILEDQTEVMHMIEM